MTIDEIVSNGIEIQGDNIRVKIWSNSKEQYVFDMNLNNIPVDNPEICVRTVKYIYAYAGNLVIELESED